MDQNQTITSQTITVVTSDGVIKVVFYDAADSATQYVSISQDDTQIIRKTRPPKKCPANVHPYSANIWQHYQDVHRNNFVIRSGLGLCGCYGETYHPNSPPNPNRQESDTEHASACVELMRSLRAYYPDLLSPELYLRAEHLLSIHDLGENTYGDRPDDGSQNRLEKNRTELTNFVLAAANLPAEIRETTITDFICFQDPTFTGHPTDIAHFAQLVKVVDKFEAILSGITYEKSGVRGDLSYKELHYGTLTAQDRYYIHQADNDSSLVASWSAHIVDGYHTYYGFPYVLDIIKAAIIDVRGKWFPWFDNFCQSKHIPKDHITHPLL